MLCTCNYSKSGQGCECDMVCVYPENTCRACQNGRHDFGGGRVIGPNPKKSKWGPGGPPKGSGKVTAASRFKHT